MCLRYRQRLRFQAERHGEDRAGSCRDHVLYAFSFFFTRFMDGIKLPTETKTKLMFCFYLKLSNKDLTMYCGRTLKLLMIYIQLFYMNSFSMFNR